jgi:hypothetical protein
MNCELKIQQSFAKIRRTWGINYAGEGRVKSMRRGRRGLLLQERRWQPQGGGHRPLGEKSPPLHGGNPLFMVVTPILILHDIHAN